MRTILYFLTVTALLLAVACTKDDNNFSYSEPKTIEIYDNEVTERLFLRQGDDLILEPQFDDSDGDYSYLWYVSRFSGSIGYQVPRDTIGWEKTLRTVIDPAYYILGEPYRVTFQVTDNRTGISGYHLYDLTIVNQYAEGWIILEDKAGQTDLSMLLSEGEVEHHIYSGINPDYPISNPIHIGLSKFNIIDEITEPGRKFYLVGEDDAIEMDLLTMQKRFDYNFLFFIPPPVKKPTFVGWSQSHNWGTAVGIIVNDGLLSTNFVGGFPGSKKFGLYLQIPNVDQTIDHDGYDYELAPFVATASHYNSSTHPYQHTMYDQKNKRFYRITAQAISTFPTNASNPAVFDMNNVGLQLLHMDASNVTDLHNALMKDDNGNLYLLQFSSAVTTGDPVITRSKRQIIAPNLVDTESASIASSPLSSHIFYGYGNTLYRYAVVANTYDEAFSFPGNEQIVNVKARTLPSEDGAQLLVATFDGQEGKLYEFLVGLTGTVERTKLAPWEGFAKIVDMKYKPLN